jgi:hypothetical protein
MINRAQSLLAQYGRRSGDRGHSDLIGMEGEIN